MKIIFWRRLERKRKPMGIPQNTKRIKKTFMTIFMNCSLNPLQFNVSIEKTVDN